MAAPLDPLTPLVTSEPSLYYNRPISAWDESDRPREKLMKHGATVLSDAELLALIFGSGTRTKDGPLSAIQLGQALLQAYESLPSLSRRARKELMRVVGVGPAKAVKLLAAFEIGRRVEAQRSGPRVQVNVPGDVAAIYGPLLRDRKQEVFKVITLNTANFITGDFTVSEGGLATSIVEPRAVFRRAILENAASVVCVHNHPSGNPEPSREDIKITKRLAQAGDLMGVALNDHIIIAGGRFTSMAERGIVMNG